MPQKPNTNREITFRSLWKLLSASERKDAARAFLSSNSDSAEKAKPHVYAGLAIAKGFRPQFLKRRSREDHINYLAASMLNQAPPHLMRQASLIRKDLLTMTARCVRVKT